MLFASSQFLGYDMTMPSLMDRVLTSSLSLSWYILLHDFVILALSPSIAELSLILSFGYSIRRIDTEHIT